MFSNVIRWLGEHASYLNIPLFLVLFFVATMRYGFNYGSIAIQEVGSYLHIFAFMLAIPWIWQQREHIRVDTLYNCLRRRHQLYINLIGHCCLALPAFCLWAYLAIDYVARSWAILEGSLQSGGLPGVFVIKTLLFITPALLIVQTVAHIIEDIQKLRIT